jgi:folate-dependent phosphoribosylglycinamide formyltransferase PurN
MRLALLSKQLESEATFHLIDQFIKKEIAIEAIFIETSFRKKYSQNELNYKDAHHRFNLATKKYNLLRRLSKMLWLKMPIWMKQWVWLNIHNIPVLNKYSVEYYAKNNGIKVIKVYKHSSSETKEKVEDLGIDYLILMNSNWLIKKPLLAMDKTKIINAHGGKLPEFRGLDANLNALKANQPIGISTHFIDEGIDTGPFILFKEYKPKFGESINHISRVLSQLRIAAIIETLQILEKPNFNPIDDYPVYPINPVLSFDEMVQLNREIQSI